MPLVSWQATVQNEVGNYVISPTITVRTETGAIASIFNQNGTAKANPFVGTLQGFAQFWAYPGTYTIQGTKAGDVAQDWTVTLNGSFASRIELVSACAAGWRADAGAVIVVGVDTFVGVTGSTAITDLPGLMLAMTTSGHKVDTFGQLATVTSLQVGVGDYLTVSSSGAIYKRAEDASVDYDLNYSVGTGVKWYVLPSDDGSYNVKSFGAVGDGVANDTIPIQAAIKPNRRVSIPAGTYIHDGTIVVPSNTHVYGSGIGSTILRVISSAPYDAWGLKVNGATGSSVSDLSLDGRISRLTPPFAFSGGPFGSGLIVQNSSHVSINRVSSTDWAKHCFDVSANAYTSPDQNTYLNNGRSRYVFIDNCYASGAGDDNFTTHQSDYIQISNCRSENPSGLYIANNSNCFEIDDGSRHVKLTNVFASGGVCGIQVKGHTGQPAPQDVMVYGAQIEGCNYGVDCYNTGRYGNGTDIDGPDYSLTAFNLTLRDIHITNPTEAHVTGEELPFALRVRSYASVTIENIHVRDATGPFYSDALILVLSGARNVHMSGLHFTNCAGFDVGVYTTVSARRVMINGVHALRSTGLTSAACAVRISDTDSVNAGNVNINFCTNLTTIRSNEVGLSSLTKTNVPHIMQSTSTSSGGIGGVPTTTISHGWVEGAVNLGENEGTAWEMTCQLDGEVIPSRVAAIKTKKANGVDSDKTHNLILEVLNASGVMVDGLKVDPEGWVSPRLGSFASDSAAAIGGVPIGGLYHTGGDIKVRIS